MKKTMQSSETKKPYEKPELKEFGMISDLVNAGRGFGADGAGGFPNDSFS